jgi:Xaa-Pro aminopeptidase
MERRWEAARRPMREQGIDALVMQCSNDWLGGYVRWLTGITANNAYPRAIVFPLEGNMSLIQQGPFDAVAEPDGNDPMLPGVSRVLTTPSYVTAAATADYDSDIVLDEVRLGGYETVGLVAPAAMYHLFGRGLTDGLEKAGVAVRDATEFVDELKALKSPEELERIRETAALQDEVLRRVCEFIRPGHHDFEVAAFAQYQAQLLGSEQGIYLGSSAPPGTAAVFRPRWQQGREIRSGDSFTLLIETNGPGGMYTELSRPIVLGKASDEQKETWDLIVEAQQVSLSHMTPGTPCADVHAAHNEFMRSRGLPEEKRLYSHGQGYDLVERPLMRQDETMAVAETMNFTVHPAVKTDDIFMTMVDNYVIGPNGPGECIHRSPKEIIEL